MFYVLIVKTCLKTSIEFKYTTKDFSMNSKRDHLNELMQKNDFSNALIPIKELIITPPIN